MGPHVLVVEDRQTTRDGIVCLLAGHGYHAVAAANGQEAPTYLNDGGPADVILLDLVMPVMDGWTFRRAQLRDPWLAHIPVIAMTALNGRPVRGVSPDVAIEKPIDLDLLLRSIKDLCERFGALPLSASARTQSR